MVQVSCSKFQQNKMFGGKKQKEPKALETTNIKPKVGLDDVVIHVMPDAFVGRKTEFTEKSKPLIPVARPIVKSKPVPIPAPKPVLKPQVKKAKSKLTLTLIIVGVLIIISFGIAGYLVVRSLDQQVVEELIVTEEITEVVESVPEEPVPGKDTDSDGLSDVEEGLYGTELRNPDTDGDTFLDGNEVFHRYSPLGDSPATLLDTGAVELFTAESGEFTFTYPMEWSISSSVNSSGITTEVIIGTDTLAVFAVNYSQIEEGEDFESWYKKNGDAILRFTGLKETLTKEGYDAFVGRNDRIAYLIADSGVYTFEYDLGSGLSVDYLQTFQMMINSFVVAN